MLAFVCRHSSMDLSAPTILPPRFRVPSTPSMMFSQNVRFHAYLPSQVALDKSFRLMRSHFVFLLLLIDQYLPEKPLNLFRETFKTCGVVSSAGSLLGSNLGDHINKNDYVIRFNNAPTHGFEKHVGTKTSLRIVNSQGQVLKTFLP